MLNRNLDVWHIDNTYKLAFREWPLCVVDGQSSERKFGIIALAVLCGETQKHFEFVLETLVQTQGMTHNELWNAIRASLLLDHDKAAMVTLYIIQYIICIRFIER